MPDDMIVYLLWVYLPLAAIAICVLAYNRVPIIATCIGMLLIATIGYALRTLNII